MRASFEGSVFIATSLDGFIARRDGSLDWLPGADGQPAAPDAPSDGDYGYASFLASVDALLMGRATYDAVLGFGEWPYGTRPVVVLTTSEADNDRLTGPVADINDRAGPEAQQVQFGGDGPHRVWHVAGREGR